jgi:DNA-binding MurR/RpiR family transcriptional regulator
MYTERIRETYDRLSPGYRRIADYLVNHYRDAAFMTAAEVGQAAKVDTTLVVRFAQRLGYSGYPELIAEVQEQVKRDLRAAYEPSMPADTAASVFAQSLSDDRNSLEYMRLRIDAATVDKVVDVLMHARRVFLIGDSVNGFVAQIYAHRLLVMGLDAHVIPHDMINQAQVAIVLGPEDVVLGIGLSEMVPTVAIMLRTARSLGLKTIGITGSLTGVVAQESDIVLHAPIKTIGIWPSITAATALLGAVIQAIAVSQGDKAADWVVRGDRLLRMQADALRERIPHIRDVVARFNTEEAVQPPREVDAGAAA